MKTVKEVSNLTGVSIRTLHHYDKIGLLKPAKLTEAGYRLYDDMSLRRLQHILLFRELEFSLKDIKNILDNPNFKEEDAIKEQITLLTMKRNHLNDLINLAYEIKLKGVDTMDFKAFDTQKIDEYTQKAKEKWGNTDAYKEFEIKNKNRSKEDIKLIGNNFMKIFAEFGKILHKDHSSPEAQSLVKNLQNYISKYYYTCTYTILDRLADMYAAGDSMTDNIDKTGGIGTAEFVSKAIKFYIANEEYVI